MGYGITQIHRFACTENPFTRKHITEQVNDQLPAEFLR